MSKKPTIFLIFLFTSITLSVFSNTDHSVKNSLVHAWPKILTDTGGRTVNLDSAQLCIDRYTTLMKEHGFSNQAGESINIRLRKTAKITTGESFNGQKLLDWLNATNTEYMAAGKTLMVKIQLGVYDANYLNTYQTDAALRAANKNRVAIFIVPYDASTGQAFRALNMQPMGGTGGGGGTGFDLGGVQP